MHKSFNKNINTFNNKWNVYKVSNMQEMFKNAATFNGNITDWNTDLVTDMKSMFNGARSFDGNISNWVTNNVTNMKQMFKDAEAGTIPSLSINKWNIGAVTNMEEMFQNAQVFNQDITDWILNTSPSLSLVDMFKGATNLSGQWSTHPSFGDTPSRPFFSTITDIINIHSAVDLWTSNSLDKDQKLWTYKFLEYNSNNKYEWIIYR